jgi:DNA-binding CsgD family transcriptional regulator
MVQMTYYPATAPSVAAEPAWEPAPDDVHTLRHGYNLADLDQLARKAVWRVWGLTLDYNTRYELAWSAIADHLYAAERPPTPPDLIWVGQDAIGTEVRDTMHHHGVDRIARGGDTMRGFVAFWETAIRHTSSPENGVVERAALWQIWPHLTEAQRRALLALAAHGTYQAAAASMGITYKTFKQHIGNGRNRFLDLWHEHEAPSRIWGCDRRVYRSGDNAAVEASYRTAVKAVRHRKPGVAVRVEVEVKHGTLGAYSNHKCRCGPCVQAKTAESTERRRKAGNTVRRQISVSQFDAAVRRNEAGETWTAIAADLGFSEGYLRSIRRGTATPVQDGEQIRDRKEIADEPGTGNTSVEVAA